MGWTKHDVERTKTLTTKQEAQIPVFAEKWDRIARSTEPWDRRAVASGIRHFYKTAGVRAPKVCGFISLVEAWNAAAYKTNDQDPDGQWSSEGWRKFNAEHPKFYDLNRSEWGMRCFIGHAFEPAVIKTVEDYMHRNVAQPMGTRRINNLADATEDTPQVHGRRIAYGQMDAPWLAIVDYFASVHGEPHCQKLSGLLQAVAACGFLWCTPEKVVYTNRPNRSVFDEQGRLHCNDDVAIRFRDGLGWFFLHGISTPKRFVETPADDLKLEEILKVQNWEVRRAVLGRFGFERMFKTVKHRVISRAGENALIQFNVNSGEFLRALHLKWRDKTGEKEIFLPVPRTLRQFGDERPANIHNCEQVRRWTLGWPKEASAVAET